MLLRIAAVALGYAFYLPLQRNSLPGAVMVWAGTVVFGWVLIDRYTLRRRDGSGLMQVGSTLLGLGLIAIGASLALS
ncbi:MAG: hypothetical protein ACRDKZ_05030 [Actinomycetota bacterium]